MRRRAIAVGTGLLLLASVTTALPVLVMRFVPPLTTTFMLRARLGPEACRTIEQEWAPRRAIAPALFVAVVAAEDQRFARHLGFDFDAIGDAIEDQSAGRPARGASTITQQVAKNLFLWPGHSWLRKGLEAWFTIWIEALWPKTRILEVYVNVAQFGRCTFGAAAASRRFFGREPAQLTLEQASLLAAVLPNPIRRRVEDPSPRIRRRAVWIQRQARNLGTAPLESRESQPLTR